MLNTLLLVSAFCALALPALAAEPDSAIQMRVADGFYRVHQASSQDGIPDAALLAKYAPYISPGLNSLLDSANAAEARFAQVNKDSPPLAEGDLFSSMFEGVTAFHVGACRADGQNAQCAVDMIYDDSKKNPSDKPVHWIDTAYLVKAPDGWRLDDIGYGGNWDFGNKGRMRRTLNVIISTAGN
jgi:hypothetical protein